MNHCFRFRFGFQLGHRFVIDMQGDLDFRGLSAPIWMLFSAAFGFLIGDAFGDSVRHRKCLEQANDDLRERLDEARAEGEPVHRQLKQQRGILNDIHKRGGGYELHFWGAFDTAVKNQRPDLTDPAV